MAKRRELLKESGLCIDCEKPRGESGTSSQCRDCAEIRNAIESARLKYKRDDWKAKGLCGNCGGKLDTDISICSHCKFNNMLSARRSNHRK